ncbi:MAG: putative spermidine/putrescine transport system substrate-binding protein, partial [Pseudonocardiales bacterium]|nr:putative spermidine/putrescine transport system substrate-binding protein [Pseudonocardiales bacterium]
MRTIITSVTLALTAAVALTACGSSGGSSGTAAPSKLAAATSLQEAGGMDALVAAAKQEGQLNTITLPANWANYGNIIKSFQAKYSI